MDFTGMTWAQYKKHRNRGEYDDYEREQASSLSVVDKDEETRRRYQEYVRQMMESNKQDDIVRNNILDDLNYMYQRSPKYTSQVEAENKRRQEVLFPTIQVESGQKPSEFNPESARAKAEGRVRTEQAYADWNKEQAKADPNFQNLSSQDKYNMFADQIRQEQINASRSQGMRQWAEGLKGDPEFERMSEEEKRRQYMRYLDQTATDKGTLPEDQRVELSEYKYNGLTDREKGAIDMYMQAKGQEFDDRTMGGLEAVENTLTKGLNWRAEQKETSKRNEQEAINELVRLGWDEDKIKTELSRYKELEDYRKTQEKNADLAIDPNASAATKWGKGALNTLDDIASSPVRGIYSKVGNWLEGDGVYGNNTSSPYNYLTNRDEAATAQVRENAIGNDHPNLQTAYDIGVSTAESLYTMLLTNAVAGAYGLSGAGTALKNAKKAGDVITKGMKGAAAAEKALEVATLVPFSANAYDSAYRDAVNRGFSEKQAEGFGAAVGATEALTEMISLDKAWKLAEASKVGRNLFLSAAIQAGIEGSEEVFSELGQRFADYVAVEVGKTGKTQKDLDIEEFMAQGMSREEAVEAAKNKFYDQLKMAAVGGAVGGVPTAGVMSAVGAYRSKYGDNLTQAISDRFKDLNVEGDTAYENKLREDKAKYENNPTQYIADNYKVNNKDDAKIKEGLEEIAQKEREGKKLSVSDKSFITENVLANRDQFNQEFLENLYDTGEDSVVPYKYRDVKTEVTEDDARRMLAQAAKDGDAKAFVQAMQKTRNSSVDSVANNAEQIISDYSGMAQSNGITKQDIGNAILTEKRSYIAGLKGEELEGLSEENQIAYNEGKMERIKDMAKTVISSKSSVESALVATNEGNPVKLTGVFDNDGVRTENGESVKVEDLDKTSESAVIKAYQYADNYNNVATKNVFLSNITDNTNIEDYNRDFKRIYDMGLAGVSEENMRKGYSSLTDDQRSFAYLAGLREARLKASNDISEDWGVTRKGTGSVINTAEITDQEALDLCAQIAALTEQDVVITSDNIQKQGNARGGFNKNESTIYVKAENVIAITHELGHYVQTYNSKGYDELRKAVADLYIQELGADKFNERMERYEKLYGGVKGAVEGVTNSADRMSVEMFNDSISAMFSTKESAQKLADYLAGNYDPKQAKSLGQKAASMVKRLANTIRRLTGSEEAKNTMYAADTFEIADKLAERADDFLIALDKAVENYRKSHVQENAGESGMEFSLMMEFNANTFSSLIDKNEESLIRNEIKDLKNQLDSWDGKDRSLHFTVCGSTPSLLQNELSLKNLEIYINSNKVISIYEDHPEMKDLLPFIPKIIHDPVLVMESRTVPGAYVLYGNLIDNNKKPVMVSMLAEPTTRRGIRINVNLITNAYAKNSTEMQFSQSNVKYITPDEKIRNEWEKLTRLQLPFLNLPFANINLSDLVKKSNTEYSLIEDSQGNKLSQKQQTYFAQSKIRDKNGALKVMHHGTAAYGFDVFDIKKAKAAGLYGRGFYFSDSDSHAGQYGKTYDVYLNIVNPLSPGSKTITDEQMLKFINAVANDEDYGIENYGYDATPQSVLKSLKGKDDFGMLQDINAACIGDFASALKLFNRINGTTYDGISTPTETVAFYPNQIKDINNKKPTGADSIYFSLTEEDAKDIKKKAKKSKNVEITKDLVAVHNLGAEQLKGILELKGLPSPSIAIIRSGMIHDKYGDISLIFNSDTIDPKVSARNKVYGGDGWTPTFPKVEVKISKKVAESVRDKVHSLLPKEADQALGFDRMDNDYLEDRINSSRGDVVDAVENNAFLKYAYLADNGEKLEIPTRDSRLSDKFSNDDIIEVAKVISEEEAKRRWDGEIKDEAYEEYEKKIREALNRNFEKTHDKDSKFTKKFGKLYQDTLSLYDTDNITRGLLKYYGEGVVTEADPYALKDLVNEKVKKDEAGYHKWISDLFDGIIEKKGLRNNKDYFLPSGNRRSWEALHDEYNLENIVRIMNQQNERGEAAFFSQSAIQALSTKKFESLNDIRSAANQLYEESEEAHEARVNAQSERFTEICSEIMDKTESNSFIAFGRASDAIADAIREGKSVKGIDRVLREYRGLNIKDDTAQKIVDLMKDIGENPTGYFEAKPRRAVWLDEIKKAVIPDNVSEDIVKALDDNNIPYEMYRHEDEGMRRDIIAGMDDVMFSLVENSNGKKLTKDQQKYFGKSGITDEQGRLEIMYHGTPQASFTVFDPEYSDDKTSLFFTNNRFVAAGYAGTENIIDPNNLPKRATNIAELKERFKDTDWQVREEDGQVVIEDIEDPDDPIEYIREDTFEKAYQEWIDQYVWDGEEGEFGGLYPVYLKAENPLVIDAEGNTWKNIYTDNLVDEDADAYRNIHIISRDNGKVKVEWTLLGGNGGGIKVMDPAGFKEQFGQDLYNAMFEGHESFLEDVYVNPNGEWIPTNTRGLSRYAKEHGYDALIVNNLVDTGQYGNGSLESKVVVVFNSNQVKSIYNEHPSEDPDIRYSLVEDSEGRKLFEGQQRYFNDSKVVDDEGRLKVMYHGARGAGFTVFDTRHSDDNRSLFFTDDPRVAKSYIGTYEKFKPLKPMSFDELASAMEGYTRGEIYLEEDGDDVVIMEVGTIQAGDHEVYRGDLKGAQEYFVESIKDLFHNTDAMYEVYLNIKNPLVIDADYNNWDEIPVPDDFYGHHYQNFEIHENVDNGYDVNYEDENGSHFETYETFDEIEKKYGLDYNDLDFDFGEIYINSLYLDQNGRPFPTNTRMYSQYAQENGYDGVIFKNLIDTGIYATNEEKIKASTVAIVYSPEQIKDVNNVNPTSSEDIRYSLVDADEGFMEFEDRKAVNILEQGMEALKNKEVDVAKLRTLAIKLRNEFGSSYDVKTFTENLQKAFAYMQTEDHVDYKTMMGILRDIARPVIEASNEKIGEQEYKDFISNFKGMKIKLTAKQKEEVKYEFGSYGAFRNAMMPITISDNGETTLDQIWDELVEQSGYMLDRDAVEGDMPAKLLDVLQALRPTVQNTYGGDMEDVAKDLAMRIVEEYIEGESAKQMKAEISEYRQKLKNEYNERLRNLKGKANAEVLARNKRRTEAAKERQLERDLRHDIKLSANKLLTWVSKPTEGKSVPHDMMIPVMQFLQGIDFVDPIITFEDGKYRTKVFDRVDYEDGHKRFIYKDIVGDTRADVLKQFNEAIGRGEGTKEQRTWASRMQGIRDIYNKVLGDDVFDDASMDFLKQTLDAQGLAKEFDDLLSRNNESLSMNHLDSKDLTLLNNVIKNIFHAINQANKA
ncbi:MAG: hypothetical protein IKN47_06915, partial [Lachnospiraceae bacterium]|nr:hypothetical protein [Lachnospiraceae bacterium]